MAEVAGTLIDTLQQRVRDPQGSIHSRDLTRSVLSIAQRFVNAKTGAVKVTVSLTTDPLRIFYPVEINFPTIVRILSVQEGGRDLSFTRWDMLSKFNKPWFRSVGSQFQSWSLLGRDLLCIYPAKDATSSVDVIGAKWTTDLTNDASATELPDEYLPFVLDLAEAVLQLRGRKFPEFKVIMDRLLPQVGVKNG